MKSFLINLGAAFLNFYIFIKDYLAFSYKIIKSVLRFNLFNKAIFTVFIRQVYFTGVQILPTYIIVSLVFGIALVGFLSRQLIELGIYNELGKILVLLIVRELGPIVTVILLALRSSTAVGAEISVMKLSREIDTLEYFEIDPVKYLYLPRIFAGLTCMVSLSIFFSFISITGGYLLLSFNLGITFDYLLSLIFDYVSLSDIAAFFYKTIMFGFFLMSIPIYSALWVKKANTEIPISLLKGMMRLFFAILFVEITGAFI
ncbi:ABC transporter permease [Deferribacter autotrophicus]|uniref:ABC transporter permease n=1 Tax=Deferribacter autotrophicus TaxID=500465 RepID=A0A5A8F6H9_9BACT|nr:ABC transporter permease [Deferribacter autotrophicus]KAA0259420.1 ABC transporter permease [Deferribacter autotrophicus]